MPAVLAFALAIQACGRCYFTNVARNDARSPDASIDAVVFAPVAFVQDNAVLASDNSIAVVPLTVAVQQGDTLVVVIDSTTQVTSVGDSASNSYRVAAGPTTAGTNAAQQMIYVASDVQAGGDGVTVEVTGADNVTVAVFEHGGLDGTIDGVPARRATARARSPTAAS